MSTKQEKLAAARKKLREFQGKSKENEQKPRNGSETNITKEQNWKDTDPAPISSNVSSTSTPISPLFGDDTAANQNTATFNAALNSFLGHSDLPLGSQFACEYFNTSQYPTENNYVANNGNNMNSRRLSQNNPFYQESFESQTGSSSPRRTSEDARGTPNSDSVLGEVMRPLQQQLQSHVQTISILVGERTELQNALTKTQAQVAERQAELSAFEQRLAFSASRSHELETSLSSLHASLQTAQTSEASSALRLEAAQRGEEEARREAAAGEEERLELRRRLEAKVEECEGLERGWRESREEVALCRINIQQLSAGEQSQGIPAAQLQSDKIQLEHKVRELEKRLQETLREKEQAGVEFKVYVQQCRVQITTLTAQLEQAMLDNSSLEQTQLELKGTVSQLEDKLCRTSVSQRAQAEKDEVMELQGRAALLRDEVDRVKEELQEKDEEVRKVKAEHRTLEAELQRCAEELEGCQTERNNLHSALENASSNKKLLAAMESDKVAAARAVSQNKELKEQLAELQAGFIKVSDEKLDLTEKLAHEEYVVRELTTRLEAVSQHTHSHQHTHGGHDGHDEHEEHDAHDAHDAECGHKEHERLVNDSDDLEELRSIVAQLQTDKAALISRLSGRWNAETAEPEPEESPERRETQAQALRQLEEKVRRTMADVAALDEEKQELEHLVLRLQGETETIGEYISLYQKQRLLLRQRTKEKDEQLLQLTQDREELKVKLEALDKLVQSLMLEKETKAGENNEGQGEPNQDVSDQIRALITEIGTNMSCDAAGFEHCPCCSGRLITV